MIAYVAGYGRSGSTLLDTILGNHPDIFGAGELTWLFQHAFEGKPCSCGAAVTKCPVWKPVLEETLQAHAGLPLEEAARATLSTERGSPSPGDAPLHASLWKAVFCSLRQVSGKQKIVDSTKSSRLAFQRLPSLAHAMPGEVRAIHLVRDPRAVMHSVGKGSNRKLEQGGDAHLPGGAYRGLAGWIRCNRLAERSIMAAACPHVRLLYSDLASDPAETIRTILTWMSADPDPLLKLLSLPERLEAGHGISGNRMRRGGIRAIKADAEWIDHLSPLQRFVSLAARPWMRRYGIR